MDNKTDPKQELVDSDLIEDIEDEEMYELVKQAQREALLKAEQEKERPFNRRPKWLLWLISIVFLFSTFSFIFEIYSIPAIEFLKTSARLSANEDIQLYKRSVVTIATEESKGTGFSISSDGLILTNYHVIEGREKVTVAFPEDGAFVGNVTETYENIDLALVQVDGDELPYLTLDRDPEYLEGEPIHFIGNPLRFHGIANEGTLINSVKLSDWTDSVMMMKAPVYRGNSGSPVINEDGLVIGVVFATMKHEKYGKVGLFVPIELFLSRN